MSLALHVGTIGMSVWSSEDRGETFERRFNAGLYGECRVFSLASQPAGGSRLFAGTDEGLYVRHPHDQSWEHIPSALDELPIWSLAQSPHDVKVMLAGTRPAMLFRSGDAGTTWTRLAAPIATSCAAVGRTRVTQILFDRHDPQLVWAGIEVDGVYRSRDAGKTWDKHVDGLHSEDLHGLAVAYPDGRRKLFAVTDRGPHVSADDGDTWQYRPLESEWPYTRAMVERTDSTGVMFLTNGNGPPGTTGRLLRSEDYGETWADAGLPGEVNSTPWCIAVHPTEPKLVFVATNLGQLYRSQDGGGTWTKLKREFGEVRALLLRSD
ncbi:MAG: hypothetical protein M3069_23515 [Chloroflexota bacterium]|nr:hypothetical protein [Chloroflexota bacterium]